MEIAIEKEQLGPLVDLRLRKEVLRSLDYVCHNIQKYLVHHVKCEHIVYLANFAKGA